MQSDLEIARQARLRPIADVAGDVGLRPGDLEMYGRYKAKLPLRLLRERERAPDGRLVLVTAITPTPAGEGKTTTTVGLGQALWWLGKRSVIALREPSLGPVFGVKGGAAGGGRAQVVPMEDINLHFTGDFHAITSAHNLLAAILDNHLQHGNELGIDPRRITWRRVLDMNDRALRHTVVGLGGRGNGVPREDGFMITVASEVMAVLCLASGFADLKERLGRMIVGYTRTGGAVRAAELGAVGAMAVLLRDAVQPNLVQTLEGTPALVHGGPFANIAHGTNSLLATRLGLKLGEYVVTEAGFGSDLGAEKFFHIVCRVGGLRPACAVLVATVRALKMHGGVARDDLAVPDPAAVARGLPNLVGHLRNLDEFGVPVVVALNRFPTDRPDEIDVVRDRCAALGVPCAVADVFQRGGEGGEELARLVVERAEGGGVEPRYAYALDAPIPAKIEAICRRCYGADGVDFTPEAEQAIKRITRLGLADLPICMAKTQYSFSDDPSRLGRPEGFRITVRDLAVSAGAGFLVAYTGDILTMPGLPKVPAAEHMDVDEEGRIFGLF